MTSSIKLRRYNVYVADEHHLDYCTDDFTLDAMREYYEKEDACGIIENEMASYLDINRNDVVVIFDESFGTKAIENNCQKDNFEAIVMILDKARYANGMIYETKHF